MPTELDLSRVQRHVAAVMAIPAEPREGTIPCPSCKRPLHYGRRANTDLLRAHCETLGCTSFVE